ncbi:PAS domain S-box protein [Haloarchaeobius amylolyticus]|uniref:PAS domain S-box protein n=1 Tax=Haloarchaeobius amylolyticus TaxID=1198296 RepID=UPI00226F480A|nr:PAS domain S-box protein [Haloarchaeobius amylolyticus]
MRAHDTPAVSVLYVDGDADRRRAVVGSLAGTPHETETQTVETAAAARDRVSDPADRPDCVLLATDRADATGVESVELVREADATVPIVVGTDDRAGVAPAALDAGATDVVEWSDGVGRRLAARRAVAAARQFRAETGRSADARVATLFENTSDAIVEARVEGDRAHVVRVNESFSEVFGYDAEEMVGRDLDEVIHSPDRRDIGREYNQRVAAGESFEAEGARMTADGPREFLMQSVRVGDGSDRAYFVYTDITERKQREKVLRMMHDATREMMLAETKADVADQTVATGVNVLGLPQTTVFLVEGDVLEPAATTAIEGVDPIPLDRESEPGELYTTGETGTCTLPGPDDATVLAVPLGAHGVLTAGPLPADSVDRTTLQVAELLATNVVSALDRAEREDLLREREAELKEQRDRFAALFENVPDPAVSYVFDASGTMQVRAVNSAFEDVMGYDEATVVGEDLDEFIIPPAQAREAADFNEELMAGNSLHTEVRRETANGVQDFLLHGVPVALGERSVFGFAIYTDTTEQKERERQLRRQNERLDEFAGIVSHDLRNPLTVARGHCDLLAAEYEHESLEDLEWALDRMEALIDDVLTLARKGKSVEDPEPVRFDRVVRSAWAGCDTPRSDLVLAEAFPPVLADGERLRALFENLFRNAMEHAVTDERDGVTVTVQQHPRGFAVADDGPGIDQADVDVVFEQGYTTAADGTGFGLAIVEDIVEAHDWSVCIDEAADGARFVFSGVEWCDPEQVGEDVGRPV